MKLPGFLSPLGLKLAGAALLLVIVLSIASGNQIFRPGPLSAQSEPGVVLGGITSHAELSANCAACHTAPWTNLNMNDQCLNCHTEIQEALKDPTSLHGVLKVTDCRACHTEHRGPQGNLTAVDEQAMINNLFGFSLARPRDGVRWAALCLCRLSHRTADPFRTGTL